jgi:hypothetical protein
MQTKPIPCQLNKARAGSGRVNLLDVLALKPVLGLQAVADVGVLSVITI